MFPGKRHRVVVHLAQLIPTAPRQDRSLQRCKHPFAPCSRSSAYPPASPSPTSENGVQQAAQQLPVASHSIPLLVKYGFYPPITLKTPTREVLSYVFAPPEDARFAPLCPSGRSRSPFALAPRQSGLRGVSLRLSWKTKRSEQSTYFAWPSRIRVISRSIRGRLFIFSPQIRSRPRRSLLPNCAHAHTATQPPTIS